MILYRPVNSNELKLIEGYKWLKFPPRLPEQPFFYPVLNEMYANQINKDWNTPAYGSGYTLRFEINDEYISQFEIHNVGGPGYDEFWIPSEELDNFNYHIVGQIEVIKTFSL